MEDIKLQTSSPDLALTSSTYLKLAMFSIEAEQMMITDHRVVDLLKLK